MQNCRGEIPSATLYEDEDFRVILDLGPAARGHALILPKAHYADLCEIPEELAAKAMILAKRSFPPDGRPCAVMAIILSRITERPRDRQCSISIYMLFPDIQGTTQG